MLLFQMVLKKLVDKAFFKDFISLFKIKAIIWLLLLTFVVFEMIYITINVYETQNTKNNNGFVKKEWLV